MLLFANFLVKLGSHDLKRSFFARGCQAHEVWRIEDMHRSCFLKAGTLIPMP